MSESSVPLYHLRGLSILGFRDMGQALDYFFTGSGGQLRSGTLVAMNAEKMITVEEDEQIRALINAAEFRYADGISIVRSLRKKYPHAQLNRLAGVDLWQALMQRAGEWRTPVFLIGGKPEVLADCEAQLRARWQVNIVDSQHGYFSEQQRPALLARVRDSGAQLVCVAMGSPRQEILMRDCRECWPDALYMGVGGSYDVFTGRVKRAPKMWQHLGLEWLYRLLSQPSRIKRQWRLWRYLYWHYRGQL